MRCCQSPRGSEAFREKHPTVGSIFVLRSSIDVKNRPTDSHQLRGAFPCPCAAFASLTADPRKYAHGTRDFGKVSTETHKPQFRLSPSCLVDFPVSTQRMDTSLDSGTSSLSHNWEIASSWIHSASSRTFAFIHFCGILSGQLSVRDFYGFSVAELRSRTRLRACHFTRCDGPRRCFNF